VRPLHGKAEIRSLLLACGFFAASFPARSEASETILYTYDARGRLVEVERQQPTTTVKTKYTYDRADNRTKKEVIKTP
jgi:YD repeat-containing protein